MAMAARTTPARGTGDLLVQLQAQVAATEPEVRDALRRGFADLLDITERASGASPQRVEQFFAGGMLCNASAATQTYYLDETGPECSRTLTRRQHRLNPGPVPRRKTRNR